ncbi:hypothetical protein WA538_004272 [Blastocystis sp. DL]
MMDSIHRSLRSRTVLLFIGICILSCFFFLVVHHQNQSIQSVLSQNRYVETAMDRLSLMLNESSLTRLFTNLYDSTIVDVQARMNTLHKKLEEDHESFVRDYTLMSSDYDAMHKQINAQYSEIAFLKEEVESLKMQLSSAQSLLKELKKRSLIDGTDRIDYAYEKNGGRVMTGWKWTTEPPASTGLHANPSMAINPPTEKGYCYPMGATKAVFTVKILEPRNPDRFSIDHISRFVTEDRRSAPRVMEIWVGTNGILYKRGMERSAISQSVW